MTALKTAEELWVTYMDDKYTTGDVMYYEDFIKALTEHDKEIRDKIGNLIKDTQMKIQALDNIVEPDENLDIQFQIWQYQIEALTELLTFIKEK